MQVEHVERQRPIGNFVQAVFISAQVVAIVHSNYTLSLYLLYICTLSKSQLSFP